MELEAGDDIEYEVEVIQDSTVYARELVAGHLPGLYYLISWKGYSEEENNWESALAVQHLRKLLSTFHKDHLRKPTATSTPINLALPMAKPSAKSIGAKQKRGQQTDISKRTKTN